MSERFSVACAFARRMQDIESDTGYDTRRCAPDGALARLSQTTVCDTRVESDRGGRVDDYRGNRKLSPVPTNTSSVGPHNPRPTETST